MPQTSTTEIKFICDGSERVIEPAEEIVPLDNGAIAYMACVEWIWREEYPGWRQR